MSSVLVVDDDPHVLSAFAQMLIEQGHQVATALRGESALASLQPEPPDLIIMDIRLPGLSGLETFRLIKQTHPRLPVIIMTGYATTAAAIEATKLGAFDYHLKPLNPEEMLASINSALECVRFMSRQVELNAEKASLASDAMIGQSPSMQEVYKAIGRVAQTDVPVLIYGETGTGKELVARAIYQHSLRAQAPLVVVNCVAIPETLLESELFGFERGAFTGAERKRIGKFERASGGTLFLDEIGDMPPGLQAKLLRVLQESAFERIGGDETISVNVRILAATNRDLKQDISDSRFRKDLYHRLSVFAIHLPALRERREDIPALARYFLQRFAEQLGIDPPQLPPATLDVLVGHLWPGNVRELQHCLHRAMILTAGYPIQPDDIRRALDTSAPRPCGTAADGIEEQLRHLVRDYLREHRGENPYAEFLGMVDRLLLVEALQLTQNNQTHAAKLLGVARPTLKAKMDKYGLGGEPI